MLDQLKPAVTVMPFRRWVRRTWTVAALIELIAAACVLSILGSHVLAPDTVTVFQESSSDVARLETLQLVEEAYPHWQLDQGPRTCPSMSELGPYLGRPNMNDPWGSDYEIRCDAHRIIVHSLGEDRVANTADDIWSDR